MKSLSLWRKGCPSRTALFYLHGNREKILNLISGAGAGQNIVSFAIGME